MKKLLSLFSMLILLSSNTLPVFTYANNDEINELAKQILIENLENIYETTIEEDDDIFSSNVSQIQQNNYFDAYSIGDIVSSNDGCYTGKIIGNGKIEIISFNKNLCRSNNLIIPNKINEYDVVKIGTGIFEYAFEYEDSIESITIPDSVEEIGERAFYYCNYPRRITINLPSNLKIIGKESFMHTALTGSFVFPEGLEYIGERSFMRVHDQGVFNNVTIPDSVYYIGEYAFNNSPVENISFGKGVTEIGDYAFQSCKIKELKIPDNVTKIGRGAFQSNSNMTSVDIGSGKGTLELGDNVFGGSAIRYFNLNKDTLYLKNSSEYSATSLGSDFDTVSITLNNYIRDKTSDGLIGTTNPCVKSGSVYVCSEGSHADLILSGNAFSGELNGASWGDLKVKSFKYPEIVTKLNNIFEYGKYYGTNITIPGHVKEITNNAFNQSQLKYLILDEGVEIIGTGAFSSNYYLTGIEFPNTLKEIGNYAFRYINSLLSLNIPGSVKSIGTEAFSNANKLQSLIFSEGIEEIGTGSFLNLNKEITEIYLPDSIRKIGNFAFCDSIYNTQTKEVEIVYRQITGYVTKDLSQEMIENSYNTCINYIRKYKTEFKGEYEDVVYPEKQLNLLNEKINRPINPTKLGHEFLGWYEENSEIPFDFENTPVTEDKTLYAHWKSLKQKTEETTTENVVYTNTTTVTVGNEPTDETLSGSSTLTLKSKEVEDKEVTTDEDTTKVQDSEIKVSSDKTVEYEGGLEVYLEKTENETTEKVGGTIKFSVPVAVKIPVSSDTEYVKVQVKHGDETFGFKGLTLNPVNECNNGEAVNDKYNGEDVEVKNNNGDKYATIYTCSASTFVAYTENIKPVISQPSAGGGRTITTKQEAKTIEQEHNSADIVEPETTQTSSETVKAPAIEEQVKKIEGRSLTRGEVAIMTSILLEVYPQLVEGKQELDDVTNACSNYADEQNFTKDEKKAITRLCKLSIMGIHADDNRPLEEFLVNDKSTNDEFSKVINRSLSTYTEKDLSVVKDALKKLEGDEENVVFGTVYDMFMGIKNIFSK